MWPYINNRMGHLNPCQVYKYCCKKIERDEPYNNQQKK